MWNNGDFIVLIDSLGFGNYEVFIIDLNGCIIFCLDIFQGLVLFGFFVWLDENRNGIQDLDEEGFVDVLIKIIVVDLVM